MSSGSNVLMTLSLCALVSACGGGGSEPNRADSGAPPLAQMPTLADTRPVQISDANFLEIAKLATSADSVPFGTVDIPSHDAFTALKASANVAPAMDFALRAVTNSALNCEIGFGVLQTIDSDGNPKTAAAGDVRIGTYDGCYVAGFIPWYVDGTYTHTIDSVTGELPARLFEPDIRSDTPAFSFTATRVADLEVQLLLEGGFVLTDNATTTVASTFDGNTLTHTTRSAGDVRFGSATATLIVRDQVAEATVTRLAPSSFDVSVTYSATLLSTSFNGGVVVATQTPMRAIDSVFQSGAVKITGSNGSSITITIISADTAQVEADFDGDGLSDRTETLDLSLSSD